MRRVTLRRQKQRSRATIFHRSLRLFWYAQATIQFILLTDVDSIGMMFARKSSCVAGRMHNALQEHICDQCNDIVISLVEAALAFNTEKKIPFSTDSDAFDVDEPSNSRRLDDGDENMLNGVGSKEDGEAEVRSKFGSRDLWPSLDRDDFWHLTCSPGAITSHFPTTPVQPTHYFLPLHHTAHWDMSTLTKDPYCTPPSSDVELDHRLPPSPPASPKRARLSPVDRLLGLLHLRRAGRVPLLSDWRSFRLSPFEFEHLNRRIEDDEALGAFYKAKVRWDYDPRDSYVLRMPTPVHESFIAHVEDAIFAKTQQLIRDLEARHEEDVVKALEAIYKGRSPTLELIAPKLENSSQSSFESHDVVLRRSPDATFFFRPENALPSLVLEVSYSQQRKDLPRLAESYIVDSQHTIRCVLGLDITYKGKTKDRTASLSVWRPGVEADEDGEEIGVCKTHVDALPFRDAQGAACDGEMQLTVADFLPLDALDELPESIHAEPITISFAQLTKFLDDAENETARKTVTKSARPRRFRKRKRSPFEELSEDREAAYRKQEDAELEKDRQVDGEWQGSDWAKIKQEADAEVGAEMEVPVRRSKRNKSGRGEDGS